MVWVIIISVDKINLFFQQHVLYLPPFRALFDGSIIYHCEHEKKKFLHFHNQSPMFSRVLCYKSPLFPPFSHSFIFPL